MRFNLLARRIILAPALGLALAMTVVACSSSSSTSASTSSSSPAASSPAASSAAPSGSGTGSTSGAAAQITANWEKFFNSSTPTSQKVALLQHGSLFTAAINGMSSLVSGLGAKVTGVTVNSATSATVNYNLTAGGSSLLSGQTGKAVYENGVWKVGDASLCGLLKLAPGGTVPSVCNSVS